MNNLDQLKSILSNVDDIFLRIPIDELNSSHKLIEDLGIDSLGRVSLFHEICFEFGKEADEAKAMEWQTIGDVEFFIEGLK